MIAIISIISTTSCISINTDGYTISEDYDTTKFVLHEFDFKDFNAVEYHGYGIITYEQSDCYSVKARSTEEIFEKTKIFISDNKLKVDQSGIRKLNAPILLTICAPEINSFDLSRNVKISCGNIDINNNFKVELSGSGNIELKSLSCKDFDADLSGASNISGRIKAQGNVKVDCSGASKGDIDVNAVDFYVDCSGATKLGINFTGNNAEIGCSGASNINMGFTGNVVNYDCSGASKIESTLKCKEVNVECSGASKFTAVGVAERTHFNTSGASSINTKELNNY